MNRGSTVLAVAVVLVLASLAVAEDLPQPYSVGGGWATCPRGYLITHVGTCVPEREGPVVEMGCEVREDAHGYVTWQTCPSSQTAWVGNVGDFGAPLAGAAPIGTAGLGIGVVSGFGPSVVIIGR
jgi:hypothetical protein